MTYKEAVRYLYLVYSYGVKEVRVPEDVFEAYLNGLVTVSRIDKRPRSKKLVEQRIMFKNMGVRCSPPRMIVA